MRNSFLYRIMYAIGMGVVGIAAALFIALVYGFFVQLLWNWLMPQIFQIQEVTYLQATGLVVLVRLMVGSLGYQKNHRNYHYDKRNCNYNSQKIENQKEVSNVKEGEE